MQARDPKPELSFGEFVALMALMISIVALSIDSVLPALGIIADELGASGANDGQLIVVFLFIGLGVGQLIFGPLSDAVGRRRSISVGFIVFFIGTIISLTATDIDTMLAGRLFQGLGLSAPRIVSVAIIRDLYEGRRMASVMSFIMATFIAVPMIAPLLGQLILIVASWQAIFLVIMFVGAISLAWYLVRQGETLAEKDRAPFTPGRVASAIRFMLRERTCLVYTVALGIANGPFVFYLSSAQQLFGVSYGLGQWFPLYFSGMSLVLGVSSYINGKNVVKHGREKTAMFALTGTITGSILFSGFALYYGWLPPLGLATAYIMAVFLCIGLVAGNINALAMDKLGHIAGIGSAIVGSLSTLISASFAVIANVYFNGTIVPLSFGFLIAGVTTLGLLYIGKTLGAPKGDFADEEGSAPG